jgi:CheY-like chemotaxis protein
MAALDILLVDDDPDIQIVARLALEKVGGCRVTAVQSGPEALVVLSAGGPCDVVLLDAMMDGMDGPETLATLRRADPRHPPVLFMTARVQAHEVEAYLASGAVGVIAKPFDPMTLADEVRAVLCGIGDQA